jgi:hypothetical protein
METRKRPSALQPLVLSAGVGTCFQHLNAEADNEYDVIDSTIMRVHQPSAEARRRRAKSPVDAAKVDVRQDPGRGECVG